MCIDETGRGYVARLSGCRCTPVTQPSGMILRLAAWNDALLCQV